MWSLILMFDEFDGIHINYTFNKIQITFNKCWEKLYTLNIQLGV